jgi:putative flippase GtrA
MATKESFITRVVQRRGVRQFVKFCIIGGLSTVIDLGLHWLLMFQFRISGELVSHRLGGWVLDMYFPNAVHSNEALKNASFTLFKVLTTGLAILNSFYWNRRWTFRVLGKESIHQQVVKFYTIALIGMVLTLVISTLLFQVIPGHPKRSWAIASLVAMVVVSFWNFFGQKLWTFKKDMK